MFRGGLVPFLTAYGVSKGEVEEFVKGSRVVQDWLGKYGEGTARRVAQSLCQYFKWLRMERDEQLGLPRSLLPRELLDEQIVLRKSDSIEDRRRHLQWALKFSRDNPDFAGLSDRRKYALFITIKKFYGYHEVPLTLSKGIFGKRRPKNRRSQITLADAKKIMGALPQRDRTVLLLMLQSGMEIGAVLNKFNWMWPQIKPQLDARAPRVKVEFDDRKGNNLFYFTYFSRDAIQELKKWLIQRERILGQLKKQGKSCPEYLDKFSNLRPPPIFITRQGVAYTEDHFFQIIDYYRYKKRVRKFVSHQFRKLFKTEASLPERGIDRDVVEFMMGHVSRIGSMGGTYDKTPEIHEEVIEKEYRKLEKYLNIYSTPPREILTHREMERHDIERFIDKLLKDPRFLEGILNFLGENMNMVRSDGLSVPLKTVAKPRGIMLQQPEPHKLERR